MLKESIRFIWLFILIFIVITAGIYLITYKDMTNGYLFTKYSGLDINIFKQYFYFVVQNAPAIYFSTFFLTILFFFNTSHLKLYISYIQGIIITLIWGILLFTGLYFIIPNDIAKYHAQLPPSSNVLQNILSESNFININGKVLFYSRYNDSEKSFDNIVLTNISETDHKNMLFSQYALLKENYLEIPSKSSYYIYNDKKIPLKNDLKIDLSKYINRLRHEKMGLIQSTWIKNSLTKGFKYLTLNDYPGYINRQYISSLSLKNIFSSDSKITTDVWLKWVSWIIEIICLIFIFISLGVLISTRSIPILNMSLSIVVGILSILGLTFIYPLHQSISKHIINLLSGIPYIEIFITSTILLILSILLIIGSILRYRMISFQKIGN